MRCPACGERLEGLFIRRVRWHDSRYHLDLGAKVGESSRTVDATCYCPRCFTPIVSGAEEVDRFARLASRGRVDELAPAEAQQLREVAEVAELARRVASLAHKLSEWLELAVSEVRCPVLNTAMLLTAERGAAVMLVGGRQAAAAVFAGGRVWVLHGGDLGGAVEALVRAAGDSREHLASARRRLEQLERVLSTILAALAVLE